MSIEKRQGTKVNMHEIKALALNTALYIESWTKDDSNESLHSTGAVLFKRPKHSAHTPSVKKKYYNRLATVIKNRLHNDKRKSKQSKIELSTYHKYLGRIRKHLYRNTDLRHPSFYQNINALKTKYKNYSKIFDDIEQASIGQISTERATALNTLLPIDTVESNSAYNDLRRAELIHPLIRLLSLDSQQSALRQQQIKDNRKTKKQHAVTITYKQIELVIDDCLSSDNFYEMAVGIALATGRRAIECVHTGVFTPTRRKHDVNFAGVAKKSKKHIRGTKYTIPLLIESKKIISAVKKLRSTDRYKSLLLDVSSLPLDDQNIVINRRVAGGLNSAIRRLFDNDNLVYKDSRTIAGNIAVEKIYKTQTRYQKLDVGAFRTKYFIHDTFEEAVNYEHINIDFNASFDATKKTTKKVTAKLKEADISALIAIKDDLQKLPKKMSSAVKLHERVISAISENGAYVISQSAIFKGKKLGDKVIKIGGSKPVIKRYLENDIVKKAIAKYHKDNNLQPRKNS